MKETIRKVLCLLTAVALLLAAGCAAQKTEPEQPAEQTVVSDVEEQVPEQVPAAEEPVSSGTHIITDQLGLEVEVPDRIDRIAVCNIYPLPSVLAIFFDSADKIVGIPSQSMAPAKAGLLGKLYPELLNAETGYIDGTSVNVEELALLEPDVVFYSTLNPEIGEQISRVGIPAVAISASGQDYDAIETLKSWIGLLGQMFPENDRYSTVEAFSEKVRALVEERVASVPEEERARDFFLFQYTDTNLLTSGKKFFGQWWADATGAVNVASELDQNNSVPVGMEQVYAWDPSVIFITNFTTVTPDDLYSGNVRDDWSEVSAVKNHRVYKMPLGMYRSYTAGVDTPVTLLWIAKTTYPELFADIDITAEARQYYSDVFGISLTDEQLNSIFSPVTSETGF